MPELLSPSLGYNVFLLGDFTSSGSDTEGRVAVGGNAFLSSYAVGLHLPNSAGTRDDLVVGGNLSFHGGSVYNGNAVVAGTVSTSSLTLANGTIRQGAVHDFAAIGAQLRASSDAMAAWPANGTNTIQYWGGPTCQITLTGTDPALNVFALSGVDFGKANTFTINAPAGSSVVVNVSGGAVALQNFGFNVQNVSRTKVLYNFHQAGSLSLNGLGIEGTIFAPRAAVSFISGQLNGSLVAASASGNGQYNHVPPAT